MTRLQYRIKQDDINDILSEFQSETFLTSHPSVVIEEAAFHYYHNNDGWDKEWPVFVEIYDTDDVFLFSGDVFIELKPEFQCDETIFDAPDDYEGD